MLFSAAHCVLALGPWLQAGDDLDFERDLVRLKDKKELRGVVQQSFEPEHVVLLREGNRRLEIPRAEIERVVTLRDRLAAFYRVRRPGLALETEWSLVEDAERVGLHRMARLQAYHLLTRDPEHRRAHEFLGHERAAGGFRWPLDGKWVDEREFAQRSQAWNHRLVLESEHFRLETDCGLRRALDILFDLEGVYLWWMEHLGPPLRAAEDVDAPREERMTFLVHRNPEDPGFLKLTSDCEPYYDPSGSSNSVQGGENVARSFYEAGKERPQRLFELATEMLMYSTLVLGRTRDEADFKLRRLSHWAEVGLGHWVALHAGGVSGYPEFRAPFTGEFRLDGATARASLDPLQGSHLLRRSSSELEELVRLPYFELVGQDANVERARARAASFVAFLIEANQPLGPKSAASSRDGFFRYLREVYGTQEANSRAAFDARLEGDRVASFEDAWKGWTASFLAR